MLSKLSDILLVSDVDGTFLKNLTDISERDIEAVRRFQSKGGLFTVASGRSHMQSARIFDTFELPLPSIHSNGSYIYDSSSDTLLYSHFMPPCAVQAMEQVCAHPAVRAAVVFTLDGAYNAYYDGSPLTTAGLDPRNYTSRSMESITAPWTKVMCVVDQDVMFEVEDYAKHLGFNELSFVATHGLFMEIGSAGVNKGTALCELAKLLAIPMENTVAIGDYTNDLEMIEAAGLGVCPENAKDTVLSAAQMIVGPCGTALSDLIEYLEQKYQ